MASDSQIYTQGCNFGNLLQKGVDPRTGQYSCAINVWEAPAQARNCPAFKLTLSFSSLDSFDLGLGEGWSFNFTYYDRRHRTLYLSTGERFRVTETSTAVSVPDQKLKSFTFRKLDSTYQVTHKSGQIEILSDRNDTFNKCVPTQIYAANGRSLTPVWGRLGETPRLLKIQESAQDLLTVDYESRTSSLVRFPGTPEESTLEIRLQANRLQNLVLPLPGDAASWDFEYQKLGRCVCITEVTSPTGLVEKLTYKKDGHKLPTGAPISSIPYVTIHSQNPGQDQPTMTTRYEFSAHNFFGYNGGFGWKDGEDNLYLTRDDYQYSSTMEIDGGPRTKYTYNRFHLIVCTEQEKGATKVTESIKYYATNHGTFESQPAQCHLPKTIEKTFEEDPKNGDSPRVRSEKTEQEYDEWGNPTKEVRPDGVVIKRTYYPAEGEAASDSGDRGCPPDPHGFQRYMATETVVPAASDYPSPTRTDTYRYTQISTANGTTAPYFVTAQQQMSVEDDSQVLSRTSLEYVDEPTAMHHGRLQEQTSYHLDQYPIIKDWTFESRPGNQLAIATHVTNFDKTAVGEETVYSTLHGLTLSHQDEAGVEERFQYSLLGQIVKATTSPGTPYETSRSYEYAPLGGETKGTQVTMTDAKGMKTHHISDGLERICCVQKQDPDEPEPRNRFLVENRSYNAQGQCVEVKETDWLRSDNADRTPQESVQQLEYDDWGQICRTTESSGVVLVSKSDPIDRTESRGLQDEGFVKTKRDISGNDMQISLCRTDGSVYSEIWNRYDGLGRLAETEDQLGRLMKYESDSFDRIVTTTWPGGRVTRTAYADHSEETLPTRLTLNITDLGEQSFDGLGRVQVQRLGPRTITQTYQGQDPEPTRMKNTSGQQCEIEYEPALQYSPTSISRAESKDTFEYDFQTAMPVVLKGAYDTQTREYNALSQLTHETMVRGEESFSSEYQYSMKGKLQRYVNPHSQAEVLTYDNWGRAASLKQENFHVCFQYNEAGRLSAYSVEEGSGVCLDFNLAYDEFGRETGRVIQREGEELLSVSQTYTQTALIATRTAHDNEGATLQNETFKYDDLNRLEEYVCEGSDTPVDEQGRHLRKQTFAFDNYDNISSLHTTFQDGRQNVTTYTYHRDDPTQLVQINNTNDSYPAEIELEYDANGCMTRDEQGRRLEYDSLCRLTAVHDMNGDNICGYRYDAAGRLISQIVAGEPDTELFYRGDSVIATKKGNRRCIYVSDGKAYWGQVVHDGEGDGEPKTQFWISDTQDSVLGWLDSRQPGEFHHQAYTPYGLGSVSPIAFKGQWRDPITGWYHLGHGYRVYNPVLMRFHSPDPGSPFLTGEINPYTYSLGDPINRMDPSGHFTLFGINFNWKKLISAVLGLAASIAVGVLTAGASLAVEVAVGTVVGGVASAAGGALGDLADGRTPSWSSVGMDFATGALAGAAGPVLARGGGALLRGVGKALGRTPTSYAVSQPINNAVWRWGLSKQIAGHGMQDIVVDSLKGAAKGFVAGQASSLAWEASTASMRDKPSSSAASKSSTAGGESQFRRPEQLRAPYIHVGSALGRDSIRPLLKNGQIALSGYPVQPSAAAMTSGQSAADILTLNPRCSYGMSRRKHASDDGDSGLYPSVRGSLRTPGDWEA